MSVPVAGCVTIALISDDREEFLHLRQPDPGDDPELRHVRRDRVEAAWSAAEPGGFARPVVHQHALLRGRLDRQRNAVGWPRYRFADRFGIKGRVVLGCA